MSVILWSAFHTGSEEVVDPSRETSFPQIILSSCSSPPLPLSVRISCKNYCVCWRTLVSKGYWTMLCSVPPPTADVLALKTLPSLGTILMKTLLQVFFFLIFLAISQFIPQFHSSKSKREFPHACLCFSKKKITIVGGWKCLDWISQTC